MDRAQVPPLNYLYFYITDGCNLKCRHCWIEPHNVTSGKKISFLDEKLFSSILGDAMALGLKGVKITGGEPLIHPDLGKILNHLRAFELELTLETNGILINPDLVVVLRDFPVLHVSVSLDGAHPETNDWIRNVKGAYRETLKGIDLLVKACIQPQIIFTLMGKNQKEVTSLVKLARELGAGSVKINCLQPVARGRQLFVHGDNVPQEEILSISRMVDEELSSASMPVSVHLPPAFRSLNRLFGEKGDGCSTCGIMGILGVLADGSYALCGIGETVKEMVFGHAVRDRLAEIWSQSKVLNEIRAGLPNKLKGVCRRCLMKGVCLGSCLAQNFYLRHDLWSPYWFCEEAEKKGLFPHFRLAPI